MFSGRGRKNPNRRRGITTIECLVIGTLMGLGLIVGVTVLKQSLQKRTRIIAHSIAQPSDPLAASTPQNLNDSDLLAAPGGD